MDKIPELQVSSSLKETLNIVERECVYCGEMTYIASLDEDTIVSLASSQFERDEDIQHYINEIGITFLQEYDKLGLLTKEASLALKPDNWIEWEENFNEFNQIQGYSKYFGTRIRVVKYNNGYSYAGWVSVGDSPVTFSQMYPSPQAAKQYCQNWLDNYLKEQNNG